MFLRNGGRARCLRNDEPIAVVPWSSSCRSRARVAQSTLSYSSITSSDCREGRGSCWLLGTRTLWRKGAQVKRLRKCFDVVDDGRPDKPHLLIKLLLWKLRATYVRQKPGGAFSSPSREQNKHAKHAPHGSLFRRPPYTHGTLRSLQSAESQQPVGSMRGIFPPRTREAALRRGVVERLRHDGVHERLAHPRGTVHRDDKRLPRRLLQ